MFYQVSGASICPQWFGKEKPRQTGIMHTLAHMLQLQAVPPYNKRKNPVGLIATVDGKLFMHASLL